MGKPIAVQGCTIVINGGVITSPAPLVPVTPPDLNILASNKPVYFGNIQVIVPSGASGPAGTLSLPVTVTITATGMDVKNASGPAVLVGDMSSGADVGTFVQGNTSTAVPLTLMVQDAGQTDVLVG